MAWQKERGEDRLTVGKGWGDHEKTEVHLCEALESSRAPLEGTLTNQNKRLEARFNQIQSERLAALGVSRLDRYLIRQCGDICMQIRDTDHP